MRLVVDTNVLVAALVARGTMRNLFFGSRLQLHSPAKALEEIEEHLPEFERKTGLSKHDLLKAAEILLQQVEIVPFREYREFAEEALALAKTVGDEDDWPFFALALKLGTPLWTNDAKLKSQHKVKVLNTSELLKILSRRE